MKETLLGIHVLHTPRRQSRSSRAVEEEEEDDKKVKNQLECLEEGVKSTLIPTWKLRCHEFWFFVIENPLLIFQ